MEHDAHSTSESGYCLKRLTQQTQTEISTSDAAIQTEQPRTCEIAVQTDPPGRIPVWIKCGVGLIGIIFCVLVLYTINSSMSCIKTEFIVSPEQCDVCQCHDIRINTPQDNTTDVTDLHSPSDTASLKENNKNLTDKLQNLTIEQQQLKKHLQENHIAQNQSETTSNKCNEDLKHTNTELNSKVKQCEIKNKDLEEKITKCITAARYKENGKNILNTTSCKSEELEESDSVETSKKNDTGLEYLKQVNKGLQLKTKRCKQTKKGIEEKLKHCNNTVEYKAITESTHISTITKLRNKNKVLKISNEDLTKQNHILEMSEHKLIEIINNDLRNKHKDLKISNEELKEQNNILEMSEHKLNQTLIHTEQKLTHCNTEVEDMKTIEIINNDLRNKHKDLKISNEELKKRNNILETSEHKLNQTLILMEQSKFEVEKELNSTLGLLDEANKEKDDLTTSKDVCETSHSALMDTCGARNNIKLTKMEEYSHEKLAVEFGEIYDEEYSNADDELQNSMKVKNAENFLLNIVKLAYELCSTYATEHKRSINESVTYIDVKTSTYKNSQETVRVSIDHLMSLLELDSIANLTLSTSIRLQEPIIKVLSEIIVNRFEIEAEKQPRMMKYVLKCLELCWMMNMHSSPIFLKFEDVTDSAIFDTKTYKYYLNGGEFLDFIVWPPVYAHEGGTLIARGIAEGKEN